jgi:peroxiredoxin
MNRTLCCFLVACSAFIISCSAQPKIGAFAKDINLPNGNNQTISLAALKGKIVLVDFWASWCRPCRQTVPGLKKLYDTYHDKGFEIYGVSLDENKDAWQRAIQQDQSNWIHVNDNSGSIANQWNISVIPTTFLVDQTGKIVAVDEEPKALVKRLDKLLR